MLPHSAHLARTSAGEASYGGELATLSGAEVLRFQRSIAMMAECSPMRMPDRLATSPAYVGLARISFSTSALQRTAGGALLPAPSGS